VICGLRYRVTGLESLPSESSIVLSKHQSAWETIALRAILPAHQSWVLKRELMRIPLFGAALARFRSIPIDRSAGRRAIVELVREGLQRLESGRWVIIFPEGTRVAPGCRQPYAIGGAVLAERSARPVVPIAHNAGHFWGRRNLRKFPGTIDLVIGPVIQTKDGRPRRSMPRLRTGSRRPWRLCLNRVWNDPGQGVCALVRRRNESRSTRSGTIEN
jgi:1-acyl-sn-glycerol-3-phosphate acyltransferase